MSTLCHTCLGSFLIKQISVVKLQFLPLLQRPVLAFVAHRLSSGCSVQASHWGVFLWPRSTGSGAFGLQGLWHVGSVVQFLGSRARAQSLWQWALLDHGLWGLPRSGIEPMSPVLTGRFLTTETPGKPQTFLFYSLLLHLVFNQGVLTFFRI